MMSTLLFTALFISCSRKPADQMPVATVNGQVITIAELARALPATVDTTAASDSARRATLDNLIDKKLFVQEARRRGLEKELVNQIERQEKSICVQALFDTVVAPARQVADTEVSKAYDLMKTTVHTRLIVAASETAAQRVVAELDRGVPFETLAVRNSIHPSAEKGGDLRPAPLLSIEEPVRAAVMALAPGQHTAPIPSDRGWQVVQLVESKPTESLPPLEDPRMRGQLDGRVRQQRSRDLANAYMEQLRTRLTYNEAGVQILITRPLDSLTQAEKDVTVAVRDGKQQVRVSRMLEVMTPFPAGTDTGQRRQTVTRTIEEDLLFEQARSMRLNQTPRVREDLARRTEEQLYRELFKREVVDKIQPTDADIREYYESHRDRFVEKDLERATPYIRSAITSQRRPEMQKTFAAGLRARAKITVNEKLLRTVTRQSVPKPAGAKTGPGSAGR